MQRFKHCNSLATKIRIYQKENNEIEWRGLLAELKFSCQEYRIDFSLFTINEYPISPPQLLTADVLLPEATENYKDLITETGIVPIESVPEDSPPITAVEPLLEMDSPLITAIAPLPMIQISRTNLCKLETCNNDRNGNTYCSTNCRVI